ncbi:hypothetical protein BDK51DRAFT_38150 [Blyttiomyces helicus]|uniref:Uncharacterized protein n=1 Tax=Blyttiomyces helicus TaxID=388810 RepID=A0A4P9W4A9_9FUNG|nr:hypothetical protein BDK51DRAFT_38150 [Blyttiomyces helicus]|eukprot:RKO86722.1 hypothetical protein BDK51DRAFT_38150 [Blyttiomyces helicus]
MVLAIAPEAGDAFAVEEIRCIIILESVARAVRDEVLPPQYTNIVSYQEFELHGKPGNLGNHVPPVESKASAYVPPYSSGSGTTLDWLIAPMMFHSRRGRGANFRSSSTCSPPGSSRRAHSDRLTHPRSSPCRGTKGTKGTRGEVGLVYTHPRSSPCRGIEEPKEPKEPEEKSDSLTHTLDPRLVEEPKEPKEPEEKSDSLLG